jgi:hypothetical protein
MALPPSRVTGSSWPELGDFVYRKRRKKGRRGRRAKNVASKDARRMWALDAWAHNPKLARPPISKEIEPVPLRRRTYGGQTTTSDPFTGKTCPGCDLAFHAGNPPIDLSDAGADFDWLDGYCIRCVTHPEDTARAIARRQAAIRPDDVKRAIARGAFKLVRADVPERIEAFWRRRK